LCGYHEHVFVEPSVEIYNLLNFVNYDVPPGVLSSILGTLRSINATPASQRVANRVGVGTGVFALGSPHAFEFSLRLEF
jgi:hypothetical protein